MTGSRQPVAGYTGVIISDSVAGYTGAEGYTGVVDVPIYSGYTGSAPSPTNEGAESKPPPPSPEAPPAVPVPAPGYEGVLITKEMAPANTGAQDVASAASTVEDLQETFDALTAEDARLTFLRKMEARPWMSETSKEAVEEIQDRLAAGKYLKWGTVIGPWVVDFASKYRLPKGLLPDFLEPPKASPVGESVKQRGRDAAKSVDPIAINRIGTLVDGVLAQENKPSPEENNYWRNIATVIGRQ